MTEKHHAPSQSPSDDESDSLLSEFLPGYFVAHKSRSWSASTFFLVGVGLVVYTLLVVAATASRFDPSCRHGTRVIPSILEDAIEYQPLHYEDHDKPDHPYFGRPGKDLSRNWKALLKWSDIRVPEEEVRRLGREDEGVHFPDGGYFGMLNVHHNLHCLMRFHHHMYSDHYFPNMTEKELELEQRHTVHCLDMIKQAIMCQPDTTVLTMRWLDYAIVPTINWTTPRACADWSRIDKWAEENWVDTRADGMMRHPIFGDVFVDGKNNASRIGVVTPPH